MKELTAQQKKSLQTRQRIFNEFCKLVEQNGTNVTVQDICKGANVSVGSFYHYFESKEAVCGEIYNSIDQRISEMKFSTHPRLRIEEVMHALLKTSMDMGNDLMRIAGVYEFSAHTPVIDKESASWTLISEALLLGESQGIFSLKAEPGYYADMMIYLFRAILQFWVVHDGAIDAEQILSKYVEEILEIVDR